MYRCPGLVVGFEHDSECVKGGGQFAQTSYLYEPPAVRAVPNGVAVGRKMGGRNPQSKKDA